MASNLPQSVNKQYSNLLFGQLRNEIDDNFTDFHQMLDIRRQQLLDKLTELEEMHDKYTKHTEAINKLKLTIANLQQTCRHDMLSDTQHSAYGLFMHKLENLEKEDVKSLNIDYLRLVCDKNKFQNCVNSVSISYSEIALVVKVELDYGNRATPILSTVNRGTNKGEITNPTGVCIDNGMNQVYICEDNPAYGCKVLIFSLEGVFIRELGKGKLKSPHSIALSSSDVFVTNRNDNYCLVKFNKQGTLVKKTGSEGSGDGQFNRPHGLCVANTSVYVCDSINNRIQAFDFSLCFLFKFTSRISEPQGIKYYSNQLFVSSHTGSTIYVYSLEGNSIKTIELTGEGSPLNKAHYFAIDIKGNFLFSEYESNCVQIFSSAGEHVASLGKQHLQSPNGLDVNKKGQIVCTCLKPGAVFQIY